MGAPYTEADCRHEAARQYAEIVSKPDLIEVGDEMRRQPIDSTVGDDPAKAVTWAELSDDDFHDARNEIHELLDGEADLSRWAVDLSAYSLSRTTELAWGHPTNWSLAVQVAHRRGLNDELHAALVEAISGVVDLVLRNRGLDCPRIT